MNFLKEKNVGILIAAAIVLWLAFFLYVGVLTHNPGPEGDDWDFVYLVHKTETGSVSLNDLTEQLYGVHRVALARILFYVEYKAFQGQGIFTSLFGLFFLALSFYLVARQIMKTELDRNIKLILIALGVMLVFNPGQLPIINSQTHSLVRTPIIFIALLVAELLSKQIKASHCINMKTAWLTMLLGIIALFFDLFGIFIIATVTLITLITRSTWTVRLSCIVASLIIVGYSLPGKAIMHLGDETLIISLQDFLSRAHIQKPPLFPAYFVFLFRYLGMIACSYLPNIGMILGVLVFSACVYFLKRELQSPEKQHLCLTLFLFILFIHAFGTSAGRYWDSGFGNLTRFYIFNCWIIWIVLSMLAPLSFPFKKAGLALFISLLLFFSYQKAQYQFLTKIDMVKADINIINGSYMHDAYNKIVFPHMVLHYNPIATYDAFLRQQHWGIYSSTLVPTDIKLSSDSCTAITLHEFIVSEKQFYELKLDAWNLTQNEKFDAVYARNDDGEIVSIGFTIPQQPSFLPWSLLSRDHVLVYMIIPRKYPLNQLELIGQNKNSFCNLTLQKNHSRGKAE